MSKANSTDHRRGRARRRSPPPGAWLATARRLSVGFACALPTLRRIELRRSLYAAALPAAFRWNPALKALYCRLTERGKSHAVALVACARKLLIFANTVVARGTPWTEKTADA